MALDRDGHLDVLILTQDGCRFCHEAEALLECLAHEFPLQVRTMDVSTPEGEAIALRGGLLFPPGIVVDGTPLSYGRASDGRLRQEIERILRQTRAPSSA